jgi:2-amino-4-hydroxy-6-hydroxymethyldihydropteridine diphosphokinase
MKNYTNGMGKHQLFICLGGNLGDKAEIFMKTRAMISRNIGREMKLSSIYLTEPWGFDSKHEFWNQVIIVSTGLTPVSVLKKIRAIENFFGREREPGKYVSRKMDIDILFYDSLVLCRRELVIPHPFISERRFVLEPLAETAPDYIHPQTGKCISDMLRECTDTSRVIRTFEQT